MPPDQQRGDAGPANESTITIVRYPNRRLYDRSQGRYVTLPEIAAMVRGGKTVTVRDSKTNEDLTNQVLTQILLEHHPERMDLFPVPILHLMLGANDIVLGFLRDYLRQALLYLELWQRMASLGSMGMPLEWMKAFMPAAQAPVQPPAADSPQVNAEVLAQRLAELERRLNALDASPQTGARRTRAANRRQGKD